VRRARRWVPALAFGVLGLGALRARAQSIGSYTPPAAAEAKVADEPPPRIAEHGAIRAPLVLRPAAVDASEDLRAMEDWNRGGNEPPRAGFTRPLPDAIAARFEGRSRDAATGAEPHSARARSAAGVTLWGTRVTVRDASGIRLHLSGVDLPAGTKFWSYGTEGSPIAFGLELRGPDGDLWTPVTFGEIAFLDVEVPSSGGRQGRFSILELAEIRPLAAPTPPPCASDAACVPSSTFPAVAEARKAVALVQFMVGSHPSWCTGTLLNDAALDGTPYLLTANHCISTQTVASSVQALWDYVPTSCGGAAPPLSSLPSSVGSTLLAAGVTSDFCLLKLTSVPPGRSFMGWDARASSLGPDTTIYRLSHPRSYLDVEAIALPQQFDESSFDAANPGCFGSPRPYYFYSTHTSGYAYHGSSGSAALLGSGQVVGQLTGECTPLIETCDLPFDLVDGAFSASYPFIARWLDAPSPTCVTDPTTLCLGARFQVTAQWNRSDGTSGPGTAISLTPDSGYFWFFDPTNVEVLTKVVSGCGINSRYWVFASGLTNVGVTLAYTDLATGVQKTYRNFAGAAFQPIQDTSAFATCP
jgi:hypothetical protein